MESYKINTNKSSSGSSGTGYASIWQPQKGFCNTCVQPSSEKKSAAKYVSFLQISLLVVHVIMLATSYWKIKIDVTGDQINVCHFMGCDRCLNNQSNPRMMCQSPISRYFLPCISSIRTLFQVFPVMVPLAQVLWLQPWLNDRSEGDKHFWLATGSYRAASWPLMTLSPF